MAAYSSSESEESLTCDVAADIQSYWFEPLADDALTPLDDEENSSSECDSQDGSQSGDPLPLGIC